MNDERRREKRAPVLVEVLWDGKTGHYDARTSDLSMGGCFVDTPGRASQGEKLKFKLKSSDADWIEVVGIITYAYPHVGFGVQFTEVTEENRKKLERLVGAQHV